MFTRNNIVFTQTQKGFTLAEVLITLGIIGVVAALTLPGLLTKCQQVVFKNQFKKQYSILTQAIKTIDNNLDYTPACYYWLKNPYGGAKCSKYDDNGNCTKYVLNNGGDIPSDYNGRFSDCALVKEEMKKLLKVTQICSKQAYKNGCIPKYKGIDTVYKDNNTDKNDIDAAKATSSCNLLRESGILNYREAWVLLDGTIILHSPGFQLFVIDINGKKGPNKWGYDLFTLESRSNGELPIVLTGSAGACGYVEKGGISTSKMLEDLFKK